MSKISGIYKITNTVTGEFYIGSSKDIKQRWICHRNSAFHRLHPNIKIYQDMTKYGKDKFTFEIIEETIDLHEREQYWIDKLKSTYNVNRAKTDRKAYEKVYYKEYNERLCKFEGEILKFSTLSARFSKKGIVHPCQEAKRYLIQ